MISDFINILQISHAVDSKAADHRVVADHDLGHVCVIISCKRDISKTN